MVWTSLIIHMIHRRCHKNEIETWNRINIKNINSNTDLEFGAPSRSRSMSAIANHTHALNCFFKRLHKLMGVVTSQWESSMKVPIRRVRISPEYCNRSFTCFYAPTLPSLGVFIIIIPAIFSIFITCEYLSTLPTSLASLRSLVSLSKEIRDSYVPWKLSVYDQHINISPVRIINIW